MQISLILLLLSLVLPFVVGPILVHRRPGIKARQNILQVTEEAARLHFPANSFRCVAQLEQMGFSLVAHMITGDDLSRASGMVSLLVHRESKILVTVSYLFMRKGPVKRSVEYVSFATEFADGKEIVTSNSPMVSLYRDIPRRRRLVVPQLADVSRLHFIHCYYVAERTDSVPVLPPPGEEIAHLHKLHERAVSEQASAGYFHFDEATARYRFTWLTSIMFTWRVIWPVRPIVKSHKRHRGRLIAKAAGISNL